MVSALIEESCDDDPRLQGCLCLQPSQPQLLQAHRASIHKRINVLMQDAWSSYYSLLPIPLKIGIGGGGGGSNGSKTRRRQGSQGLSV